MVNIQIENESVIDQMLDPICYKRFDIVIPAFDEEKRISPVLKEITAFISRNELPWNVIVSIDGDDRTDEIALSFALEYPFIKIDKSSKRRGMGGAIVDGIGQSQGDYIILMDGDGSSSIRDMIKYASLLNQYDIVNFNRYSKSDNTIPFKRRFFSRSFNLMLRLGLGIRVKDTQCGYKILRNESIKPVLKHITFSNAFFLSDLFYYVTRTGLKTIEVPISYNHTDGSKFNVLMTAISYIIAIIAIRIRNSSIYDHIPSAFKDLYYKKFRYL